MTHGWFEQGAFLTIYADDHGALGDGVTDDGDAIRAALQTARDSGDVLELRAGATYYATAPGDAVLIAAGPEPVRLDGQGARLLVGTPQAGALYADGVTAVEVSRLTVDYWPLPFTQGVVTAVDAETFTVRVDPGYVPLDDPGFRYGSGDRIVTSFMTLFEPDSRLIKRGVSDCLPLAGMQRGPGEYFTLRLTYPQMAPVAPGDLFVYIQREKGNAFFADSCGPVRFTDVTVHASPGVAFVLRECEGVTVEGCTVVPPQGTDRLVSTNADGVHCQGLRSGPRVLDSHFERMLDDGVNTYACPSLIVRAEGPRLWLKGGTSVRVGDELEVLHPPTGQVVGRETVLAAENDGGLTCVTLSQEVPTLSAGEEFPGVDIAVNRSACGSGFEIRGNTFRIGRARAAVIRGSGGVISDNTIEGLSLWGIEVANDADWPEGPVPGDVTITGNTFDGLGRALPSSAIMVGAMRSGRVPAEVPQIHGIRISYNRIRGWTATAAIALSAVADAEVFGNDIVTGPDQVAVALQACSGVLVDADALDAEA